jgi:hypothetical protein
VSKAKQLHREIQATNQGLRKVQNVTRVTEFVLDQLYARSDGIQQSSYEVPGSIDPGTIRETMKRLKDMGEVGETSRTSRSSAR